MKLVSCKFYPSNFLLINTGEISGSHGGEDGSDVVLGCQCVDSQVGTSIGEKHTVSIFGPEDGSVPSETKVVGNHLA
jgi:hypothetical protein